jgi:hypothetical protein
MNKLISCRPSIEQVSIKHVPNYAETTGLRLYPSSPNFVTLQLRGWRGSIPTYASVGLGYGELIDLRNAIEAVLGYHFAAQLGITEATEMEKS